MSGFAATSPSAAQEGPGFTAEETSRLSAGKLVSRPWRLQQNGRSLIGGSSWRVIDAPPNRVWQALHDVAHYRKMLPRVIEARPVQHDGANQTIYFRNGAWPIFVSYYVLLHSDRSTLTITFQLDRDRPHGLNDCWGFVRLVPYGADRTLMAFAALADLGRGIIAAVGGSAVQRAILEIPSSVKRFLQGTGHELYSRRR